MAEADINISSKKAVIYSIIIFILTVLMDLVSSVQINVLDMSVRAITIGLILGLINYLKHKYPYDMVKVINNKLGG